MSKPGFSTEREAQAALANYRHRSFSTRPGKQLAEAFRQHGLAPANTNGTQTPLPNHVPTLAIGPLPITQPQTAAQLRAAISTATPAPTPGLDPNLVLQAVRAQPHIQLDTKPKAEHTAPKHEHGKHKHSFRSKKAARLAAQGMSELDAEVLANLSTGNHHHDRHHGHHGHHHGLKLAHAGKAPKAAIPHSSGHKGGTEAHQIVAHAAPAKHHKHAPATVWLSSSRTTLPLCH